MVAVLNKSEARRHKPANRVYCIHMKTDNYPQKTLIQQIHEGLLTEISGLEAFDKKAVENIKDLIQSGELKKAKRVSEAILPAEEEKREAAGTGD